MRFSLLFIAVFCCLGLSISSAQEQTIGNIRKLISFSPFYDGNGVAGYFYFHEMGRNDDGLRFYRLDMLDKDLNMKASKSITGKKNFELLHSANTDNSLLFLFADPKNKAYTYRIYDTEGKEQSSETFHASPSFLKAGHSLTGLNGKGFIHYAAYPNISSIQLIADTQSFYKNWLTEKRTDSQYYTIEYLASNDSLLLSLIVKKLNEDPYDARIEYFIMGTKLETGEEVFETKIEDEKFTIQVSNSRLTDEGISLFGFYYDKPANILNDKNLGLCAFQMDLNGNLVSRKFISWEKDISGFAPADKKGRIEGIGYLYFHDFIKTQDGKVFGIAENYRKTANALGIANLLFNPFYMGGGVTKMTIEDLYVFEFTPDFDLRSMRVFDKVRTDFELSFSGDLTSPKSIANRIKESDGFDYKFTKISKDSPGFVSCYFDAHSPHKRVIGSLKYDGNDLTRQESPIIKVNSFESVVKILPGKTNQVLIYRYFPRKRQLKLELKPLAG